MGILTNFLKLLKPESNDFVDVVKHISENYDKLDQNAETTNKTSTELRNNKLDKVNTIEELKSQNLKVGDIIEVLGYHQAGDGSEHKRVIADSDDGSGVLLENGLYANIVHNGKVNVSWFGAKGDGVTDDGDIIKKAIIYCNIVKLDNNKVYATTKTIYVGTGQKTLTSSESVERGMAKIKYIGELNQKGAVVIVGANSVGKFDVDATADVLSNIQIDANNLCGIGVYSTYATNETRIENVVTYNTLEYGMYFGKSWYATFRNLTAKFSQGNGIAFGMELRFSDGSVIKPADNEHIIQLNGVFIDGIRANTCGKEAESQDYKYGYGVGIGKGNDLNVTNIVSENCGIGILVERTHGNAFNVSGFYCERNNKGFILDTRSPIERNVLIGTIRNGFINGELEHINGTNDTHSYGGILIDRVVAIKDSSLPNSTIIRLQNCSYTLNKYFQPIDNNKHIYGRILGTKFDQDLRYTGSMELTIPKVTSLEILLFFFSKQEYTGVTGSFLALDENDTPIASYSYPTTIKKGINFVRNIPISTRKLKGTNVSTNETIIDITITAIDSVSY